MLGMNETLSSRIGVLAATKWLHAQVQAEKRGQFHFFGISPLRSSPTRQPTQFGQRQVNGPVPFSSLFFASRARFAYVVGGQAQLSQAGDAD
jgi:hypothetical protein